MNRALPPIVLTTCLAILAPPATTRASEPAAPALLPTASPPILSPPIPSPAPPPTHVRSGWLIAGGAVTIAGGLAAAGVGGLVLAFAQAGPWCSWSIQPGGCGGQPRSSSGVLTGAGLIAGGVVLIGGGVVMTVFGAEPVPDAAPTRERGAARPTVALGPRGVTATWSF